MAHAGSCSWPLALRICRGRGQHRSLRLISGGRWWEGLVPLGAEGRDSWLGDRAGPPWSAPPSHFPAWWLSSHFATTQRTESTFLTWSSALWHRLPLPKLLSVSLSLYSAPGLRLSVDSESPIRMLRDGRPSHTDRVAFRLLCSP